MHKSAPPCPASFSAQSSYHSSPSSSPPQSSSYNSPSPSPCYSYYYYYHSSSSSSSYFASYSYSSFSSSYSYSPSSSSSYPSPSCRRELHGLQGPSGAQERQARRPRGLRGHVGHWGTRLTLRDPVRSVPTIGLPMCPSRWRKTLSALFWPQGKIRRLFEDGVCSGNSKTKHRPFRPARIRVRLLGMGTTCVQIGLRQSERVTI